MKKKTKLLFVHHAGAWGGAPIYMTNIIQNLDKNKYEIKILMLAKSEDLASRFRSMGIDCEITYESFFYTSKAKFSYCEWSSWRFFPLLVTLIAWFRCKYFYVPKELQKHDYDVLVLNSSCLTAWLQPNYKLGKKTMINIQEPLRKRAYNFVYSYFFKRQLRKYADSIIAISEDNAMRTGVPDKTVISRNFAQIPSTSLSISSYSSNKILYLGGSSIAKGFYTVVKALPYINNDITLFWGGYIGTPPKYTGIKKIVKSLLGWDKKYWAALSTVKNAKNVKLIGLTDEVSKYLDETCCLISPFLKPHFSRPVIESYLHKKPVVVTDIAGMREFVSDGKTGFIVPNSDPVSLAKAINYVCSHPAQAQQMGNVAYEFAKVFYTEEPNIKIAIDEYDRISSLVTHSTH